MGDPRQLQTRLSFAARQVGEGPQPPPQEAPPEPPRLAAGQCCVFYWAIPVVATQDLDDITSSPKETLLSFTNFTKEQK